MESNKIDYVLVGIVVALTGFEFAFRTPAYLQIIILFFIAIYFLRTGKRFSNVFFLVLIPFVISMFLQSLIFPNVYFFVVNTISIVIKFLTCYLILEITKYRLNKTFVGFIYFLALFSFIFYPTQFFPGLQESIKNSIGSIIKPLGSGNVPEGYVSKTLIFFTYLHNYGKDIIVPSYRNCGAFWEPGMFAVFLNLALLINIFINKAALFSQKNIVFMIALATTISTTGYIILFLIIISSLILNNKVKQAIIYIPIIIAFSFIAYTYVWKLEFMSGKITEQTENASYNESSRFGAALYHFELLKESPLSGVFLKDAAKDKDINYEDRNVTPNGISLIFMLWGIPIGIAYYILIYSGLARWLRFNRVNNNMIHFLFFFIFILSAFSQDVTNRHFYFFILLLVASFPRYPIPKPNYD